MQYYAEKCFCIGFSESLIRDSSVALQMFTIGTLFHHDSVPAHTSSVAMATILDCSSPPYCSPTLFTRFCSLLLSHIPKHEKSSGWLTTANEVMDAMKGFFGT